MFRIIIIAICAPLIIGSPLIRPRYWIPPWSRIVGGKEIDIKSAPHQISLQSGNFHTCGGSIISQNLILTAAHCTDGATASRLQIRAGSNKNSNGGVVVKVQKIFQHEKYDRYSIDFDYSILKLEESLKFSEEIKAIKLADQDQDIADDTECVVTGWGNTQSSQESNKVLRSAKVPKFNQEKCNKAYTSYGGITDRMICAGFPKGGVDACQGDSGGPLVSLKENILIGVVSWGYGCAVENYPGVYSRVAAARNWIDTIIKENTPIET